MVPALITWDVDPTSEKERNNYALNLINETLQEVEGKCTFYFTAEAALSFKREISLLLENGHEIGCHGLTHGDEEEYDKMPENVQRQYLVRATAILEDITGCSIRSFRAPRVKVSHITHHILQELGYRSDSSVGSQRIDFVSSNLINLGWIFAPRLPYHPHKKSAFKAGDQGIWEVPISAFILPFISSTLYVFRQSFMNLFFDLLYRESLRTHKPIVYLAHPYEFAARKLPRKVESQLSLLQRIRTRGFRFRKRFYIKDEDTRFAMNLCLFQHMQSYPDIHFLTVSDFVAQLSKA